MTDGYIAGPRNCRKCNRTLVDPSDQLLGLCNNDERCAKRVADDVRRAELRAVAGNPPLDAEVFVRVYLEALNRLSERGATSPEDDQRDAMTEALHRLRAAMGSEAAVDAWRNCNGGIRDFCHAAFDAAIRLPVVEVRDYDPGGYHIVRIPKTVSEADVIAAVEAYVSSRYETAVQPPQSQDEQVEVAHFPSDEDCAIGVCGERGKMASVGSGSALSGVGCPECLRRIANIRTKSRDERISEWMGYEKRERIRAEKAEADLVECRKAHLAQIEATRKMEAAASEISANRDRMKSDRDMAMKAGEQAIARAEKAEAHLAEVVAEVTDLEATVALDTFFEHARSQRAGMLTVLTEFIERRHKRAPLDASIKPDVFDEELRLPDCTAAKHQSYCRHYVSEREELFAPLEVPEGRVPNGAGVVLAVALRDERRKEAAVKDPLDFGPWPHDGKWLDDWAAGKIETTEVADREHEGVMVATDAETEEMALTLAACVRRIDTLTAELHNIKRLCDRGHYWGEQCSRTGWYECIRCGVTKGPNGETES